MGNQYTAQWTPEHDAWIRERHAQIGPKWRQMQDEFNAAFDLKVSTNALEHHGRRVLKTAPPSEDAEPEPPTLDELVGKYRTQETQRYERALLQQLISEKSQTDQVIEAIRDLVTRVPAATVERLPAPAVGDGQKQTAFLMLSDLHVGAVADLEETGGFGEYNYPVFRRRLFALRDAVRSITAHHRLAGPVDDLVAPLLGDLVENDEIFPAQSSMIDLDLMEQVIRATEDLAEFYVSLLDTFQTIFVPCVTGNHGRIGKKGQRKRFINWDYLIGHMLEMKLEAHSDRIMFEIPKAPFLVVNVEGKEFLLRHGDGIKSWGGIPYYGIARSTGRWIAIQASQNKRFDYMCMGHFHQAASIPYTGGEVLMNGCFPGVTEYSVEVIEGLNTPMQLFGFVHPSYGLAARYPILLDRSA